MAENELFVDLQQWVNLERVRATLKSARKSKSKSKSAVPRNSSPIRFLPPTKVGPFEIQPIKATGSGAVDALNKWMKEHHFDSFTAEQLGYYIDRDWTFLAVRIIPEDTPTLQDSGSIPPLHIQFKSKEAVYPLNYSTHMGVFSSQITLITTEKLSKADFEGARCQGFEVVNDDYYPHYLYHSSGSLRARGEFTLDQAPESLQTILKERFSDIQKFHTSVLLNESVNKGKSVFVEELGKECSDSPSQWSEDLAIPALPPYQKQEKTFTEPSPKKPPAAKR